MSSNTTHLRYTPGEDYLFLRINYVKSAARLFANFYWPWADKLIGIEAITVRCKEHHRVPIAVDPEQTLQADGFIFHEVEDESKIWYNQYPKAHYGQMDDSYDRKLTRPDDFLTSFEEAKFVLDRVHRGIEHFEENKVDDPEGKYASSLEQYLEKLTQCVNDAGFQVEWGPLTMLNLDGTLSVIGDIRTARISKK